MKTLSGMFFGNVAPGVFVSAVTGLDLEKLPTRSAQDCGESSLCTSKCLKTDGRGTLLEDEVGKVHDMHCRL